MEPLKEEETFEARRMREKEEAKKRKEKAEALVRKVSKVLGFTLEKERNDWDYVSLTAKKGDESLHFASGSYYLKDRIEVSGSFPKTRRGESMDPYRYGEKRHQITVSVTKTPEQIAKEIERRFLPRYRELLQKVLEGVRKSNEYAERCVRNLEAIKGSKLTDEERRDYTLRLDDPIYGEVRASGEDARIELHSVPIETAQKIIRLMRAT